MSATHEAIDHEPFGAPSSRARAVKARWRLQRRLLAEHVDSALAHVPSGMAPTIVEVGATGMGWFGADRLVGRSWISVIERPEGGERPQTPLGEKRLATPSLDHLPLAPSTAELVLAVDQLHPRPLSVQRGILHEMFRVARPGRSVILLGDVVTAPSERSPQAAGIVTASELFELVYAASGAGVAMRDVRSIRYPGEDVHRGMLVVLANLGVPTR